MKRVESPKKSVIDTEPEIDDTDGKTSAAKTLAKRIKLIRNEAVEQLLEYAKSKRYGKQYVINSRTNSYTLGRLARRKDEVGRAARAERDRRSKLKNPPLVRKSDAYHTLTQHILTGGKRKSLMKVAPTLAKASPKKVAKTIKTALTAAEQQKAAKRREKAIIKRAVAAERARLRNAKKNAAKRSTKKQAAEGALRRRVAKELIVGHFKHPPAKTAAADSLRPTPTKPVKVASAPSGGAPAAPNTPAAHTLKPTRPVPYIKPMEPEVVHHARQKVFVAPDGHTYFDHEHYLSQDGKVRSWEWLRAQHDERYEGSSAYPHELPDSTIYANDPRALTEPPPRKGFKGFGDRLGKWADKRIKRDTVKYAKQQGRFIG